MAVMRSGPATPRERRIASRVIKITHSQVTGSRADSSVSRLQPWSDACANGKSAGVSVWCHFTALER